MSFRDRGMKPGAKPNRCAERRRGHPQGQRRRGTPSPAGTIIVMMHEPAGCDAPAVETTSCRPGTGRAPVRPDGEDRAAHQPLRRRGPERNNEIAGFC